MKVEIELTDTFSLDLAESRFRLEAERLLGWAKKFKENGESEKLYSLYMHRCRRLNRIATELKLLADSYES